MTSTEAMFEAAKTGDVSAVQALLEKDLSLASARNAQGETAILAALYRGHRQAVEVLLAAGAETDIYEASAIGQLERVQALVAADPSLVNAYAPDGFFPLGLAAFFGHKPVVEFLLACGADVNAGSRNHMSVRSIHAAVATRHTEIAEILLAHGADVNAR